MDNLYLYVISLGLKEGTVEHFPRGVIVHAYLILCQNPGHGEN